MDRILDFLVENQLVPHIEVSNKPKKLMRVLRDDMLAPKKGDSPFKSPEMIQYFFSALMRHLIRRYGAEVLDKWVFEFWMEEDDERTCEQWRCYDPEMIGKYLDNFSTLAQNSALVRNKFKGWGRGLFAALRQGVV